MLPKRMLVLAALISANSLTQAEVSVSSDKTPPSSPDVLWFDRPASVRKEPRVAVVASGTDTELEREARKIDFYESLPVGNGRLGAMDCGGVDLERVILNESSVWSGGDYDANKHEAYKSLPEVRRLLFAGDIAGAQSVLDANFGWVGKRFEPTQFGCYQTLGDLLVKSSDASTPATNYRRELDLSSGVVKTSFTRGGVRFTRELLVSKPAEVIAMRLRADKPGALNLLAALARPAQASAAPEGKRFVLKGQLTFDWPGGVGVQYRATLGAKTEGGQMTTGPDGLHIEGASEVVLVISAGTDMKDKAYEKTIATRLDAALSAGFDQLLAASVADYRSYMDRCVLELPAGTNSSLPIPERTRCAKDTPDPALDALYFRYGRHLLLSSSRPDSPLPANLQGIWAEETKTPWNGDFHSNINIQMNYWPADSTGLGDCTAPLYDLIRRTAEKGAVTAKSYYNAPGWMCFHTQNPWGFSAPTNLSAGAGSTCGAWLCQHIWSHYSYSLDKEFLRKNYPVLRGAAEFFLAALVPDPETGYLVTAPSNSPENHYVVPTKDGKKTKSALTYGATYDMEIIRELLKDTASAARVLGEDAAFVAKLDATRAKLAPTRLNADGRIMEWIKDYEETEIHHRHVSPLWGLYPGTHITEETPDLVNGARLLLERRGDAGTGWSMAWKSSLWAHLKDGDHAHKLLAMVIGQSNHNLFNMGPIWQIDGNLGATSAMTEMLLQCPNGVLTLLPALPPTWDKGHVKGLRAQGNLGIDIEWNNKVLTSARISGHPGATLNIVYGASKLAKTIPANGVLELKASDFGQKTTTAAK